MKKVTNIAIVYGLLSCGMLFSHHDNNLIILVDPLKRETPSTHDMSITHQLLMALHQKSSAIIASPSLFHNYTARAKKFEQGLQNPKSIESSIYLLYTTVNGLLAQKKSVSYVNNLCNHAWVAKTVPLYAALGQTEKKDADFNLFCYLFCLDKKFWKEVRVSADLMVFVPASWRATLTKKSGSLAKKISDCIVELQLKKDLVVYLAGHGQQEAEDAKSRVAALTLTDFLQLLQFLHDKTTTKLVTYLSCYAGGYLAQRAYELPNKEQLKLRFPVLVISSGPHPVYPHGLLSGVMLPPYRHNHELTPLCATGALKIKETQQFAKFFKQVHDGNIAPSLGYLLDPNTMCEDPMCLPALYQNLSQIRVPYATSFVPFVTQENLCVVSQRRCTFHDKAVLLDTKHIEKISLEPGMKLLPVGSHIDYDVTAIHAPKLLRKPFFEHVLISLEDAHPQTLHSKKIYLKDGTLSDVYVFYNPSSLPRFITKDCDKIVWYKRAGKRFIVAYDNNAQVEAHALSQEHYDELLRWLKKKIR